MKKSEVLLHFYDNASAQAAKKILEGNKQVIFDRERALFYKVLDRYKCDQLIA